MNHAVVEALGWALIHSLWECGAAALLFAVVSMVLRSANARYLAGCVTMLFMMAAPIVTFRVALRPQSLVEVNAVATASSTVSNPAESIEARPGVASTVPNNDAPEFLAIAVWLWMAGVIALSMWQGCAWIAAQRLKRRSTRPLTQEWDDVIVAMCARMRIGRAVRLYESAIASAPTMIGWVRPVVLVPASALLNLSTQELEAVLAHELAHIRRFDYVANLVQTGIETLLFYHPAVWWTGARLRAEREHCCDDMAVRVCGDRLVYARALTSLEEMRCGGSSFALAATGGPLRQRIQRLLGVDQPLRRALPVSVVAVVTSIVAIALMGSVTVVRADRPLRITPSPGPSATVAPVVINSPDAGGNREADPRHVQSTVPDHRNYGQATPVPADTPPQPPATPAAVSPAPSFIVSPPVGATPAAPATPEPSVVNTVAATPQAPATTPDFRRAPAAVQIPTPPATAAPVVGAPVVGAPRTPAPPPTTIARGDGYLAGLANAGYTSISVDEIIELKQNGVGPAYIKAMLQAGFGTLTPRQLINLRINGVDPEYARAIKAAGLREIKVEDLIHLHQNGVRADLVQALGGAGYSDATVRQIIDAQNNGLSAAALRSVREQGFKNLSLEQVMKLKRAGVI